MSIGTLVEQVYLTAVGLAALVAIYGFILYRNSWRWRQLAETYGASPLDRPLKQRWTNMILHGAGAWNSYAGITFVGVNEKGITLKILPPFSFAHAPLFFPYDEVSFEPTRWLFQNAREIRLRHDTGLHVVISEATARWIEKHRAGFGQFHRLS